jgi:hypothetical protein
MGQYGYADINLEFEEGTTLEEINALMKEIKAHEGIDISNEANGYFEIHSGRIPNLVWQCEEVAEIIKKHSCVNEASFNAYTEYDLGIYYKKEDEEE